MTLQKRIPVYEHHPWQLQVIAILNTPPASPSPGDRYIIGSAPTGVWAGLAHKIAWRDGATWHTDTPVEGWHAFVKHPTSRVYIFKGGIWVSELSQGDYIPTNAGATENEIPQWGQNGLTLKPGKTVSLDIRPSGVADDLHIPTEKAVRDELNLYLASSDALVFKGIMAATGIITSKDSNVQGKILSELQNYSAGWVIKYGGATQLNIPDVGILELNDSLWCISDNTAYAASDWRIIQGNIEGAVSGPSSAVSNNLASFDGTTGKLIKNSGIAASAVTNHNANTNNPHQTTHAKLHDKGVYHHGNLDYHLLWQERHRKMNFVPSLECIVYDEQAIIGANDYNQNPPTP